MNLGTNTSVSLHIQLHTPVVGLEGNLAEFCTKLHTRYQEMMHIGTKHHSTGCNGHDQDIDTRLSSTQLKPVFVSPCCAMILILHQSAWWDGVAAICSVICLS